MCYYNTQQVPLAISGFVTISDGEKDDRFSYSLEQKSSCLSTGGNQPWGGLFSRPPFTWGMQCFSQHTLCEGAGPSQFSIYELGSSRAPQRSTEGLPVRRRSGAGMEESHPPACLSLRKGCRTGEQYRGLGILASANWDDYLPTFQWMPVGTALQAKLDSLQLCVH